ncbi:MAG: methionyl-tRNA formyltransferase [Alphaproteobacteria bacterium]|nr:methionyl-tRNA formyltransferase [Alphaproteobacteria bacterium]
MNKLRIGFMGTPDFSVFALESLYKSGHDVVCVYSQPPRPKGRGHKVQRSPVHEYADLKNIPVLTPKSLKDPNVQKEFTAYNLDVAVVAAYGLLLPQAILNAPRYGCLNIHASLLPRWRGASPVQQAIWAGDKETGVGIMQMEKGLDTGSVIQEQIIPITSNATASSLYDQLSKIGGKLITQVIERLADGEAGVNNRLPATVQNDALSTYAPLLTKDDGRINWSQTAIQIDRQIRALNPWPGVWSIFDDNRIKILESTLSTETTDKVSGTILDKNGIVACGKNSIIKLVKIQPAGTKPMSFSSALNGGYVNLDGLFL